MAENPDIGKGFQKENKEKVLAFWKKLHDSLNSMGPPSKSISDWKKVWIDQKRYVRKKAVQNAQNRKKTGGGPCKEHVFSVLEQSILDLTATIESEEGLEGGKTFGLQPTKSIGNKQSERDRHDEQDDLNEGTDVEELSFLDNIDCENIVKLKRKIPRQRSSQNEKVRIKLTLPSY
ncbi:uncharacterized protein LOC118751598 [Rhagoletis pomonella]|uniref:uncharacterized protein LOC118751598 n=1 Tax=Rhagoletis pomonella TaxID=28610 RepID=UPI00178210A3|nr:uncharacterized protein LOC118751598 [Rhagoletis pomonella]